MVSKQTNKGGQMTHGEKMAILGQINILYELALEIQNKINKLDKQLKEDKNGSSKASNNRT
jgi:cell division protein ZapA (FtsZ GTPase activity inhibitor)